MSAKKSRSHALATTTKGDLVSSSDQVLLGDLRTLIESARMRTAQAVNAELVLLHWRIGKRIREEILEEQRAPYGEQIVSSLATQLTAEFGRGYGRRNLFNMIRFA